MKLWLMKAMKHRSEMTFQGFRREETPLRLSSLGLNPGENKHAIHRFASGH